MGGFTYGKIIGSYSKGTSIGIQNGQITRSYGHS